MGRAKNIHIRREEGTSMIKTIGSLWGMDKHSFIDRRDWSQYWGAYHSITHTTVHRDHIFLMVVKLHTILEK